MNQKYVLGVSNIFLKFKKYYHPILRTLVYGHSVWTNMAEGGPKLKNQGVAIKHKMFLYALGTPRCMGSFKFKKIMLYLCPNISIMYSNCILETGKCWQAHNSPIGWHFVFTNYPPIGEYRRVGLVWPAFNSTKTCQGYLYRDGGGGR